MMPQSLAENWDLTKSLREFKYIIAGAAFAAPVLMDFSTV